MALQGQHWSPSHVQVTVLRARGLRAKGKHGTSDAFAIIQLGKEKYCTSVLEKTLEPQWREECSFEVMPGWVEEPQQHGRELFLAVMHRSLMGLDKFLGQLSLPLVTLFQDKNSRKSAWYKLCSKPGQPEKPRGEIQISVQFVRNNLTASMFDLSSREKQRSALGKLKDKMKGRKKHDGLMAESASAIVPSSVGQIYSDEEFGERETPEKKPKKGFFSKPRLHKSSLTKSNTSLCSQHSMKSMESIGSSTGALTVSPPQTPKTPTGFPPLLINKTNGSPSLPKILTHKRALSDEVGQTNVSDAKGLAPMSSPLSRSSLCINGSHVYSEETPASGLFPAPSSLSRSLLDVDHQAEEPPRPAASQEPGGRRGSEKADSRLLPPVITVGDGGGALDPARDGQGKEGAIGSVRGAKPVHAAAPIISTVEPTKKSIADETKKASIFPFGSDGKDSESKRSRTPSPVRKSSSLAERGRTSGWFLKDSNHKPSLEVSPMVETSSDAPLFSPCLPLHPPPPVPPVPLLLPPSLHPSTRPGSLGHTTNTNPFTAEEGPVPSLKPTTNPFFSALQSNPFFEDLLADQVLKSPPFTPSFSSLTFGSPGTPDVSVPCSGTTGSNGRDSFALAESTAKEELRAGRPPPAPAPAVTTTNVSSFQRSVPSAPMVASEAAMWSAVFPATGPDAEVKGQARPSPPVTTNAVSMGDWNIAVPSVVPRQRKMEPRTDGASSSSIFAQAVDRKDVEMGPSVPTPDTVPIQACVQRGSILVNFSGPRANSKAKDDSSSDTTQDIAATVNAKPLDLKTCPAPDTPLSPAMESLPRVEGEGSPATIPSAAFGKAGRDRAPEIETGRGSLAAHQETAKEQKDPGDAGRSSAPAEGGTAGEAKGRRHVGSAPPPVPAPDAAADDGDGTKPARGGIVPSLHEGADHARGDECLVSPPDSQVTAASESRDTGSPCDSAERTPESTADKRGVISGPPDERGVQFTQAGPPPPKPPRLLACTNPALGEERERPQGHPESALPLISLSQRRLEQKASLVAWGPSVDELNPDRTDSIPALSAVEEPVDDVRPSTDVTTKREASCGAVELSTNEKTGFEHYKTCLSTLSVEGINTSADGEGNSNKLDVFQETLVSGLIEVDQAKQRVQSPPALLEATAPASSLETASRVWDRPPAVPERRSVRRGAEGEVPWPDPDRADQSELGFVSAVEELPHKSSPLFPGAETSSGSGGTSEGAGRPGGAPSAPSDSEGTLTGSAEAEAEPRGPGLGPFPRSETRPARAEEPTPADGPALSDLHPPSTDQEPGPAKADDPTCDRQPVDLQPVGGEQPAGEDCTPAALHRHPEANDSFFEQGLSFKDLHRRAAPHALQAAKPGGAWSGQAQPRLPPSSTPLAFSTPYPVAVTNSRVTDLPSPILFPSNVAPPSVTTQAAVASHHSLPPSSPTVPALTVLPRETQPAEMLFPPQTISPHPVKPISTAMPEVTEKKSGRLGIGSTLSSGLEKLKNATTGGIIPVRSPAPAHEEQEAVKESKPGDPVARYYHLTHDELIQKILQQELELQKKSNHVRDLEDYIDLLLVQIIEQKPSILQSVSQTVKNKAAHK